MGIRNRRVMFVGAAKSNRPRDQEMKKKLVKISNKNLFTGKIVELKARNSTNKNHETDEWE